MYKVEFTESAVKQLKKLDKQTVRVIKNWVIKNLVNTPDPRLHGKALKGNLKGIWRYRVGDYSCLLYTSPSPRDRTRSRMPSSA